MDTILDIQELTKSYGETQAIDGLILQVQAGEMFGLVGPDGAGKTTLVRTLCGILTPDGGSFTLFGLDGVKDRNKIKNRIGYLSQKFSQYGDLTVNENLAFFARIHNIRDHKDRGNILLEKMGIGAFGGRLADKLSGGMKQKLALACTLIHSPEILFLDEPTTGVDPVSRRKFWQILSELKKDGLTIVVTTPYMDEAERCDRVAFVHEGRALQVDTPQSIKRQFGLTVIEIVCSQTSELNRFMETVGRIESIQPFGDRMHLICDENRILIDEIRNKIEEKNFDVKSMKKVEPSLEDIFTVKMKKSEVTA